jgi:hypothetical protein
MTEGIEQKTELPYSTEEARAVWEEVARVYRLHNELANLYRNHSGDTRTIRVLWQRIEEGEAGLAALGVQL